MKWLVFLFFIYGCYLPKTAEKQLEKAQKHYPEIVAKKASELYPAKIDSIEFIKWKKEIDTIVKFIELDNYIIDTFSRVDTFRTDSYRKKYEFQKWVNLQLKKKIAEVKPIYVKDSAEVYHLKSEVDKLTKARNSFKYKFSILSWILISFLILFILYLIAYILKRK